MAEATQERKNPINLLTGGYVMALLIIAIMSLCIHMALVQVVAEQNNAAVVTSARQAKLSQKAAFYATQYVEYKDAVFKDQFEDAVRLMETSHAALIQGNDTMDLPSHLSPVLRRIYFALPYNLDSRMADFIAQSDILLAVDNDDVDRNNESYRYIIETARGPLLGALDAATMQYEAESDARIGKLQFYQVAALAIIFATLLAEALFIFRPLVARAHKYAEKLRQMADSDPLTGIDNKRAFMRKAAKEIKRCQRHKKPLSVAVIDIDNFKAVNDRNGHLVGDEALKAVAQFVLASMRLEDEFARLGGEEFVVLLPHTPLEGAELVAERIRNIIEISPVRHGNDGAELFITVSIGVAEINPEAENIQPALDAADKALYEAKKGGRNRVVLSDYYSSEGNVVKLSRSRKKT